MKQKIILIQVIVILAFFMVHPQNINNNEYYKIIHSKEFPSHFPKTTNTNTLIRYLMDEYGFEKFLEFGKITTWKSDNKKFVKNFNKIYPITLGVYEETIKKKIKDLTSILDPIKEIRVK